MKKQDHIDVFEIAETMYGLPRAMAILKGRIKDVAYQGFDVPLPDVVGYKQHGGECASDAIQEVLLFADGIREYTQPILYGLTPEQIDTRSKFTLDYKDWDRTSDYITFIQKRFRIHYDVINYIRTNKIKPQKYYSEYETVCALNPLFRRKERTSIEAGVIALKRLKEEEEYTGTGLSANEVNTTLINLLKWMNIPFSTRKGVVADASGMVVSANMFTFMAAGLPKRRSIGHAIGFLQTKGAWYYYDDNWGFIQVDLSVIHALRDNRLRIVTYKKIYFVKAQASNKKFESVWVDGEWKADMLEVFTNKADLYHVGLEYYSPHSVFSIVPVALSPINEERCEITAADLRPRSIDALQTTMTKFRDCIYANPSSNSTIFESMYRFLFEHIELVKKDKETLDFLQNTRKTVVTRPACTPMIHLWCFLIDMNLEGKADNNGNWFEIPKLNERAVPVPAHTPPERLRQIEEAKKKEAEKSPTLIPCLPGQVRDPKTKKCHDRKKKEAKEEKPENPEKPEKPEKPENTAKSESPKTRKSKCPKGEVRNKLTGLCEKRLEPCPPGEVRDPVTKDCRPRIQKCPPDQVWDPKTKKCRDAKKFVF
jgi:hypothetical protein